MAQLTFLSPLHKASRQLEVHIESGTRKLGLSSPEGHLISYLGSYGPAPVGELVRVFGHKQSTLTSMLDRLERAGYLRRERSDADRRSLLVRLTPKGVRLRNRAHTLLEALERDIRDVVSARDVEGFHAVMRAVGEVTRVELRLRETAGRRRPPGA